MSRDEWLKARKKGIGSSDVACLYGVGYMTELELYEEKTSDKIEEKPSNYVMNIGNEIEPLARNIFSSLYNLDNLSDETFDSINVRMKDLPFMMASLDGATKNLKEIIEIKYQGASAYAKVQDESLPIKDGRVPFKYWIQIQHQLLVSGAQVAHFVSYNPEKPNTVKICKIYPDVEFHQEHIKKCIDFWVHVENKVPPKVSDNDYVELDAKILAKKYVSLSEKIDKLNDELKAVKEEILAKVTHPKMHCGRLNIRQETRDGSIRYKDIPIVAEMTEDQLNAYRSKPSIFYKLSYK